MKFEDMPIRRKLTLALMLTGGVTLLAACAAFVAVEIALFRRSMVGSLSMRAQILAANSTGALAFEDQDDAREVLSALRADPHVVVAVLYDRNNAVFATYPAGVPPGALPAVPERAGHRFTRSHLLVYQPVALDERWLGTLFVQTDLTDLWDRLQLYALITLVVLLGALALAFVLASRLQHKISQPILALAGCAQAVSDRKDYSLRAAAPGRDELGRLTDAFNSMLAHIQDRDAALRASEERFRTMADTIPQLAWIAQASGQVSWFNRRWLEYTGGRPGMDWQQALDPETVLEVLPRWITAIASGGPFEMDLRLRGVDGRSRTFLTRVQPLKNENGEVVSWFGTNTDVEEIKQAEERVRLLNLELEQRVRDRTAQLEAANRELEAFSYSVSHDLRAPLRHIGGFVNLLRKSAEASLPPEGRRHLDIITDSAAQMGRLIDDLLVFSRMGRTEPTLEAVDLQQLTQEAMAGLAHEIGARNVIWNVGSLPVVRGDRAMLKQVFANLLANAVKYSRTRDPAVIEVGSTRGEHDEWIVHVRDNGVGFDMEYADKLFGVFQRLHTDEEFEGTGIGLANVRRIVSRHGGRTWAEGAVDRGATFYFSLPNPKEPPV